MRERCLSENVRIPERVLDWRAAQREGSIMSRRTFQDVKRRARREGYDDPSAVAGKGYWITVLSKYLEEYPYDRTARRALNVMLKYSGAYANPRGKGGEIGDLVEIVFPYKTEEESVQLEKLEEAVIKKTGRRFDTEWSRWGRTWYVDTLTVRERTKLVSAIRTTSKYWFDKAEFGYRDPQEDEEESY